MIARNEHYAATKLSEMVDKYILASFKKRKKQEKTILLYMSLKQTLKKKLEIESSTHEMENSKIFLHLPLFVIQ